MERVKRRSDSEQGLPGGEARAMECPAAAYAQATAVGRAPPCTPALPGSGRSAATCRRRARGPVHQDRRRVEHEDPF